MMLWIVTEEDRFRIYVYILYMTVPHDDLDANEWQKSLLESLAAYICMLGLLTMHFSLRRYKIGSAGLPSSLFWCVNTIEHVQ